MPASVGSVQIKNNFGSIQFGDTTNNSPSSITKSISGAGGGNSGNTVNVTIENSSTNMKVLGVRGRKRRCSRRRPIKRSRKCVRKCLQKRVCCSKKCRR
ncbi:spore germination protein [Brevibacillus sp. SIMBA_040]|uniref:spore germination protein n=1 Tax=unclassified Brevibacillus TaxID=2684853 RepID=UPI00397A4E9B